MNTILDYLFVEPFPFPWLIEDIIALLLGAYFLSVLIRREKERSVFTLLEFFAFIFLYASIYENAACVMGLYSYGRSLLMIGYVPFSVPLIEALVLFSGMWLLEKTPLPKWLWPPILGFFGMLQDFSLDPVAIRQVFPMAGVTSGRWNWIIDPTVYPNILHIPVFNFPGWMLIMLYGSACILLGRWWYKRSGNNKIVGYLYPAISAIAALLLMISPLSSFFLWLQPLMQKGSVAEWIMLAIHLIIPILLLLFLWRGRMTARFTRDDWPIFVIPTVLHLTDIVFALIGGFTEIYWLVFLASIVQTAFLSGVFIANHRQFTAASRA
jgi:hypothetical protein